VVAAQILATIRRVFAHVIRGTAPILTEIVSKNKVGRTTGASPPPVTTQIGHALVAPVTADIATCFLASAALHSPGRAATDPVAPGANLGNSGHHRTADQRSARSNPFAECFRERIEPIGVHHRVPDIAHENGKVQVSRGECGRRDLND
jgi:hypothetical protein